MYLIENFLKENICNSVFLTDISLFIRLEWKSCHFFFRSEFNDKISLESNGEHGDKFLIFFFF